MNDPIKDAARQMDAWADRQAADGITGSVRMMGQTIGPAGNAVTPVYERTIGDVPTRFLADSPEFLQAAQRWLDAKREYEIAERDLEAAVRKLRG